MKKIIIFLLSGLFSSSFIFSQTVTGKLKFQQGQTFDITVQLKSTFAQQAMGQSIDFNVDGGARHSYKVTNTTDDNSTLNHSMQRVSFAFDGMGQKKSFDSDVEKDINGQFGKPIKEMLDKKYDIIIDTSGKVLMAIPEKITLSQTSSQMAIIASMLKDVIDLVQPPQKGKASFFKIFPEGEAGKGATWTTSEIINGGKVEAAYVIADINDSTIIVDFAENSSTITKAEMMGSETTTTMSHKSKGKIILDKITGIVREKNSSTESSGNTESSFGTMPVTAKTTTTITVRTKP